MLRIDLTLEDNRIIASRGDDSENPNCWGGVVYDNLTGKSGRVVWTDTQIAAVVALAFGIGEDTATDEKLTAALYAIAETAISDLPPECRPIP